MEKIYCKIQRRNILFEGVFHIPYTFSECIGICKFLKMILTFLNIGKLFDGFSWWLNGKEFIQCRIPELGRSPGEGNGKLLQYSCLGNPIDRGAWPATVHGVTQSDTTEAT